MHVHSVPEAALWTALRAGSTAVGPWNLGFKADGTMYMKHCM